MNPHPPLRPSRRTAAPILTGSIGSRLPLPWLAVAAACSLAFTLAPREAAADFSGAFAPANFTLSNTNANGTVNMTGAPASISITGGNSGSLTSGDTTFSLAAPFAGRLVFNWAFSTSDPDGAQFDPFGYVQNGAFVQVITNGGANSQSGVASLNMVTGQITGFRVHTNDNTGGASTTTISSLSAILPVYWRGNANGLWTGANWTTDAAGTNPSALPDSTVDVIFSASGGGNQSTTLGGNFAIHRLTIQDPVPVTIGGANTLTLTDLIATAIDVQSGAGLFTMNAALILAGGSNTINVSNAAGAVIGGKIGGSIGLGKTGAGTLVLSAANTFSGALSVQQGTLSIATINNASTAGVLGNSATAVSLGNTGSVTGTLSYTGASAASDKPFTMATGGTGAFNVSTAAATLTLSGQIDGSGALSKTGSGTLQLSGSTANTYGGLTTVSTGTLLLNKSGAVQAIAGGGLSISTGTLVQYTGTSPDMMGAGAVTINGTGQLDFSGVTDTIGNVSVAASGATAGTTPLKNTAVGGNLTIGNLGITPVAGFNSVIDVGIGTLTLGGTLTFTAATTGRAQIAGTALALVGNRIVSVGLGSGVGYDLEISSGITGIGSSLTKQGTGRLVLSGANTFTGGTSITAGTLIATNASALNPASGGAVTVSGGALNYIAATDAPLGLASTLTLTGGAGTAIGGTLGSTTTSARINVVGVATATGAVTVNLNLFGGPPAPGTYTLVQGGAGSSLDGASYSLSTVFNNTNWTVGVPTASATALQVTISAATPIATAYWKGGYAGGTTVWTASNGSSASNWTTTAGGSVQGLVPGSGADVIISAISPTTAPSATVLGANMSIKSLTIADLANGLGLNADGSTLTIGTGVVTANAGVPASTIAASLALGGTQSWSINSRGGLTVSGAVSGAGSFTKAGLGTLTLSGSNSFTGNLAINGGVVAISSDAGLGNTANSVSLAAGGTLRFASSATLAAARVINVNGTSPNPSGLDLGSGVTAILGASQLTGSGTARVSLSGGTTPGILSVEGANAGFTGSLTVGAPGQLVGQLLSSRLFSTSNGATLLLQNAGTLANVTSLTVNNASALILTQSATAVTGRLGGAMPMAFHSARFQYNPSGNGGSAIADSFGNVTADGLLILTGGSSAGPAAGTTLNFGTLTPNDHATVGLRSSATLGSGSIGGGLNTGVRYLFSSMADSSGTGTSRGVVPWAAAVSGTGGTDFNNLVTYDANGFRQLTSSEVTVASSQALWDAALATPQNVSVSVSVVITGTSTINALVANSSTTETGSGTLVNTSGAVANFSTTTFNGPALSFPNGAYFHLGFPVAITGASSISGAGGVTTSAITTSGSYQLRLTSTVANTFTGGLFINGNGQVTFTANNQLGQAGGLNAGDLTLGGGQLLFSPASATTVSLNDGASNRAIIVNASNGTIGTQVAAAVLQIPGTISGAGQVQFGGGTTTSSTGVVELTNASTNTFNGGALISPGILRFSNANQLGTGPVLLNGGTLQASANLAFASAPTLVASSTIDTQTFDLTLGGGFNGTGTTSSSLTKSGTGALIVAGPSDFVGNIALSANGGTLLISGAGSLATGSYAGTISTGTGTTLKYSANGDQILSGSISGSAALTKDTTAFVLTLSGSGANSYTGLTTVSAGTLLLAKTAAVAVAGSLSIGNSGLPSTVQLAGTGGNQIADTATVTISGNGLLQLNGRNETIGGLATGTGVGIVEDGAAGPATLTVNSSSNSDFTGILQDGAAGTLALIKIGTATQTLSGGNTFTGGTSITAGTLIATNVSALNPTSGGAVTVSGGALNYIAATDAPLGLASTLTLTGGAGTAIGGMLGSTTTSARINVAGAATATGAVAVNVNSFGGTPAPGTYTLVQGGAGSSLDGATYALKVYNNINWTAGSLTASPTALQVTISSATPIATAYWKGGLSGGTNVWAVSDGSTSNWATTPGAAVQGLVPGSGADVIISATAPTTAPSATVLGVNMSIKSLTIADLANGLGLNADGNTLTLGTGGLTANTGVPASIIAASLALGGSQSWSINSRGGLTVSGAVSGAGSFTKAGLGTLTLSGSNSFTGNLAINGGVVSISADSSLGNAANGVSLAAGATLRFGGATTLAAARVIAVNGTSLNPSGLDLGSGVTAVLGASQLTGSGTARVSLSGLTTGILSVEGANAGFTGSLTVGAPGQLVGQLLSARLFSTSNGATLQLQNAGTLANATSIGVNNASALTITQPASAVIGRLGSAVLNFHSGRFQYNPSGNGGNAITDSFGNVTADGLLILTGGSSAGPAAGTTLNFGTLTPNDHATVGLRSNATLGTGSMGGGLNTGVRYLFSSMADSGGTGTSRGVVPWAAAVGSTTGSAFDNLVTYDANGFRQLTSSEVTVASSQALWDAALATPQNVSVSVSIVITGTSTINALVTNSSTTLTGTGTLVNNSGAVISYFTPAFNGPALSFPNGAYFHLGFPVAITGASSISGAGGVTTSAITTSGSYQLRLTSTVANTFTGGLFINGNSQVTFTANNQLGQAGGLNAGDLTLGGGQLLFSPASATTVSLNDGASNRAIIVNASNGTIGTTVSTAVLQIPGTISGAGQVQFGGGTVTSSTGVVELTNPGANTFTGGALISPGILRLSNANQLGTGPVLLNGGTLQASANLAFASAPTVVLSSVIDTQGFDLTLDGGFNGTGTTSSSLTKSGTGTLIVTGPSDFVANIALSANGGTLQISGAGSLATGYYAGTISTGTGTTLKYSANGDQILSGSISGSAALTKDTTASVLTLTGANTYSGATTVSQGTLALSGSGSFASSPSIAIASGATLNVSAVTGGTSYDGTRFAVVNGQTLRGTGTVLGAMDVSAGGTIAPGNSIGTLATAGLSLTSATSHFALEIDLGVAPAADLLNVTGGLSLANSTLDLSLANLTPAGLPKTYLFAANDLIDPPTGIFGTITGVPGGYTATVNYAYTGTDALGRIGDGNDLAVTIAAVPEPAPIAWMLLSGALALGRRRRAPNSSGGRK